jgi:hypothetical protein
MALLWNHDPTYAQGGILEKKKREWKRKGMGCWNVDAN